MDARSPRRFSTTRWSLVLAAGSADPGVARDALSALCDAYWMPVYTFVRRLFGESFPGRS